MVKRIYVEKKIKFNSEAEALLKELKDNLAVSALKSVRVINRYDVSGVDEVTFNAAVETVFFDATVDNYFLEEIEFEGYAFATSYLPGQFDQRADSAEKCIKLIKEDASPLVKYARVIVLEGELSENEIEKIKKYIINPVDSCETIWDKPESLEMEFEPPETVKRVIGFIELSEKKLYKLKDDYGFAMSNADIVFVQQYFHEEGRDPTITELRVIDTYWSDHCRHTTFNTKLNKIKFGKDSYSKMISNEYDNYLKMRDEVYAEKALEKDISLMDLAVIGAKYLKKQGMLDDLDESDEVNACSIKVNAEVEINGKIENQDWLLMFKNETHNHPTEIEPFGGAATCLGGAIRDPLSGRSYVYQAMRVTGSGDPRAGLEDTLPGKLSQYQITKGAARGYSSYGNQIGLATGQVDEIYDEGYIAKRMEVGAVIGATPAENVVRQKPQKGDRILLVGGKTGRDGCGGATGSSKEHDEDSIKECGAEVQKGNPPVERNLQRLFRRREVAQLIKKCNDFGAGGVSVAIGELADSIDVNLDLIPKKYEGLDGTELAISESQERMAVVVSESDVEKFIAYAMEENSEATAIAQVTETGRFRMYWREDEILNLTREFLDSNGVKQIQEVKVTDKNVFENIDAGSIRPITSHINDLNCASKKGLIDCFDSTIGAGTVLMPLGGKYQLTPSLGMAAKLPLLKGETNTVSLMSYGYDPKMAKISPFHGAVYAVVDSVTKIVAMGGNPSKIRMSFQEYYEKLGDDPKAWAKPFEALLGALKIQSELGLPSIGGKDSMSGTFKDLTVPPTLISFAVGMGDASKIISPEFKRTGSSIVLLTTDWDDKMILDIPKYKSNMKRVYELIQDRKVLSANTIAGGGIFVSLLKMCVGNKIGAFLDYVTELEFHEQDYGGLILEIGRKEKVDELFEGLNYKIIGHTTQRQEVAIEMVDKEGEPRGVALGISLDELIKRWESPLEGVFPTKVDTANIAKKEVETLSFANKNVAIAKEKFAFPQVVMPVFQGTNCEVDSKRAFEKVGAKVETQLIRDFDLSASIDVLVKKIRNSQILMIPGGFSGGDEPDGSAKFIAAVFRNPRVSEEVHELIERGGLILGICNGFQALIKLGLVPYGKIVEPKENMPTLTTNTIGRHISTFARARVSSKISPWFENVELGEVFTLPVSHGEGRFVGDEKLLDELKVNGQIASQYVDLDSKASMDIRYNPNGSDLAIEAITSPDGHILGKMAHSERVGENLYKNIRGNFDQKLFKSGVEYFK